MATGKYRLLTRSDFDGLACAVLLRELDLIDEIKFVHPRDMQEGSIEVSARDMTANLPFVEGVHLAFDHHVSEVIRGGSPKPNRIIDPKAFSAARVVFGYYGGDGRFPKHFIEIVNAADKIDSAAYDMEDVMHPRGWTLLGFITDSRTGFGRFRIFRISNYDLMMDLIDHCRTKTIDEILVLPDVLERIELYRQQADPNRRQIERSSRVEGNVLVTDLRQEETIYVGNRFLRYALYPETNISMQVMWGLNRQNTVITLGKSIFNKTSQVNIGAIMLEYGGGGHENAGTCQVANEKADEIIPAVVEKIREP